MWSVFFSPVYFDGEYYFENFPFFSISFIRFCIFFQINTLNFNKIGIHELEIWVATFEMDYMCNLLYKLRIS